MNLKTIHSSSMESEDLKGYRGAVRDLLIEQKPVSRAMW